MVSPDIVPSSGVDFGGSFNEVLPCFAAEAEIVVEGKFSGDG